MDWEEVSEKRRGLKGVVKRLRGPVFMLDFYGIPLGHPIPTYSLGHILKTGEMLYSIYLSESDLIKHQTEKILKQIRDSEEHLNRWTVVLSNTKMYSDLPDFKWIAENKTLFRRLVLFD